MLLNISYCYIYHYACDSEAFVSDIPEIVSSLMVIIIMDDTNGPNAICYWQIPRKMNVMLIKYVVNLYGPIVIINKLNDHWFMTYYIIRKHFLNIFLKI